MEAYLLMLVFTAAISQVASQRWQNFRNGRPMRRNLNSFRRSNQWQRNLPSDNARNSELNTEQDGSNIEFDDPTVGLIDFLDQFFEEDNPEVTDFGAQTENSIRFSRQGDNSIDLGDAEFNSKLEQELLFGDAFKDVEETTGNIVSSRRVSTDQNNLAEQIRRRVRQMLMQPNTNTAMRQPIRLSPSFQSQNTERIRSIPFRNQNIRGGNQMRNISVAQFSPNYPLLLLVNTSTIENARNNFNQRRAMIRGPNTDMQSERTRSLSRSRDNQHITNSDISVTTRNSTRSFSSTNDIPNAIDQALNLALSGMQISPSLQTALERQNNVQPGTVPDIQRRQTIQRLQSMVNSQGLRNVDNVPFSSIQRATNIAAQQQAQTQMTQMPNLRNNRLISPFQIPNRNRLQRNQPNLPGFRNGNIQSPDTPGLTRQQQLAQQSAIQQRALARRIFSQNFLPDGFSQEIRRRMFLNGPFQFRNRPFMFNPFDGLRSFGGFPAFRPLPFRRPPFFF